MKILLALSLLGLCLLGCAPAPAPTVSFRLSPAETASLPAITSIPDSEPLPSPTAIQLPFNSQLSDDVYCKPPYAILQGNSNSNLSEEEIVKELMRGWQKRYASPDAPLFCRIEGFTIDKVYDDPNAYSSALEPRGDFMRIVLFSVKLIQIPTDWMSFTGELDQKNWLHIGHIAAISKVGEGYKMEFANPQ